MTTLTVWKFSTSDAADQAEQILQRLQREQLLQIVDAAVVSWPADAKKPKTRQLTNLAGAGALGGAFWGLLFGLLFFIPFLGLAIGAATGAIAGSLSDVGIDDKMIKQLQKELTPGTSALFLMTEGVVLDKVAPELEGLRGKAELIQSNLTSEQEAKLKEVFSEAVGETPAPAQTQASA